MSDPLSTECAYCGSPAVLDDAWWCDRLQCWEAYRADIQDYADHEARTPLTRRWAERDLYATHALLWWQHGLERLTVAERAWTSLL